MAGYDPKAKRAHSPAADDKAPVDDLLGAPAEVAADVADEDEVEPFETFAAETLAMSPHPAPAPAAEPVAPASTPRPVASVATPGSGPAPKVLAIVAAVVAVLAIWRWRRR